MHTRQGVNDPPNASAIAPESRSRSSVMGPVVPRKEVATPADSGREASGAEEVAVAVAVVEETQRDVVRLGHSEKKG